MTKGVGQRFAEAAARSYHMTFVVNTCNANK